MEIIPSPLAAVTTAYSVPKHLAPVIWKLDSNEGQPPDKSYYAGLADEKPEMLRWYPKRAQTEARLAECLGLDPLRVLLTAGGDESLERACRAVLAPGRELILPVPTFEMIGRYAALAGAKTVEVDWPTSEFPLADVLSRVSERTAAIAVVTPNNPTGATISAAALRELSYAAPQALLLVDLAYTEFADEDLTELVISLPNAVGVRTFSKAWGLAGARLGYAFGPSKIIGWMRALGNPYSVPGPSIEILERVLRQSGLSHPVYVAEARKERERLESLLRQLETQSELLVQPSQANFVFFRSPKARWIWEALASLGFAIRQFTVKGLEDALRITCPGDELGFSYLTEALTVSLSPEKILFDVQGMLDQGSVDQGSEKSSADKLFANLAPQLKDLAEILPAGCAQCMLEEQIRQGQRGINGARSWLITNNPKIVELARKLGVVTIGVGGDELLAKTLAAAGVARIVDDQSIGELG